MKLKRILQSAPILGLAILLMAVGASATTITYNTSAAGTGFGGTSLTLNSNAGAAATLTYIPQADVTVGLPSNISLGNFTLACPSCTDNPGGTSSFFDAFTFNLIVTDITDGATGQFVGTSTGGAVYNNLSGITINWSPLQLGPGTNNVLTGDFDVTVFSTTVFTGVPSPNSGGATGLGQVTVQGYVDSTAIPEPATLSLVGGVLLGLGLLRRKLSSRS